MQSWAKIAAGTVVGLAFVTAIVGGISVSVSNNDRVAMGVQSGATTLAGMSREEVRAYFRREAENKLRKTAVILKDGSKIYKIQPSDIHLTAQADAAAKQAYGIGRDASPVVNIITQMRCAITGANVPLTATYDENLLQQKLAAIKAQTDRPPKNADIQMIPTGGFERRPASSGRTLDIDALGQELAPKLKDLKLTIVEKLTTEDEAPAVATEDLAAMDTVLASYTTSFLPGARGQNIAIAAGKLQDVLIKSGDEFSFNDTVGRRTYDAGYQNAGVYIDGEPAQDVGGGVCQVSSTLYNAILLAGLMPTVRTPHFYPSHYCPPGLDATVADDLLDFQFKNGLAHNVLLKVSLTSTTLTIYVIGTRADLGGQTIRLSSEGPRLRPSVYRLWYKGGQLQQKEFLHTDEYAKS